MVESTVGLDGLFNPFLDLIFYNKYFLVTMAWSALRQGILKFKIFETSNFEPPVPPKSYYEYFLVPFKDIKNLNFNINTIREILFGIMLSDGSLSKRQETPGTNAHFIFGQSTKNGAYFFHVFEVFYAYISRGSVRLAHSYNPNTKKYYHAYHFKTISVALFTEFYTMFYLDKVKRVPLNLSLLTPVALAHFIMGDGSFRPTGTQLLAPNLFLNKKGRKGGIVLCTESFTALDAIRIADHLNKVLGIECTTQKGPKPDNLRVYIRASSVPLVRKLVSKYMVTEMLYKLGL